MRSIDLSGKVAVVSGGGGEIGFAISQGLAEAGAKVVALDLNVQRIEGSGLAIEGIQIDLNEFQGFGSVATEIHENHGLVDIFVHSAGLNISGSVGQVQENEWDAVMSVNLKSAFFLTQAFLPYFNKNSVGKILFITSISARLGYPGFHAYSASKAGLDGLVRSLSTELAQDNICVNGLAPGTTQTEMTRGLWENDRKSKAHSATIPMNRMAACRDHVGPCLFFCSDLSDYMTGQVLCSDGGLTSVQADFIDLEMRNG